MNLLSVLIVFLAAGFITYMEAKINTLSQINKNMNIQISELKQNAARQEESCSYMLEIIRENARISSCYETIEALCAKQKDSTKCSNLMRYVCE